MSNYKHACKWMWQEFGPYSEGHASNSDTPDLIELGEQYAVSFLDDAEEIPDWVFDAAFDTLEQLEVPGLDARSRCGCSDPGCPCSGEKRHWASVY